MFNNKKVFILGMARSGYEAAKFLVKKNCQILITDMKEQDIEKVKELEKLGVKIIITDNPQELLDNSFDYVVKNPGIKINHPVCEKAHELNIPVTNEVEVAYNYLPKNAKIIGITGSNGKTTTTTLVYELLKAMNLPVKLGGNIGYPLCSLMNDAKENDIFVLEISGHQLHDVINFKTDISIMTNLSEVHLDHFGTYDNYKFNKCKIFEYHTKKDIAILNYENKDVMEATKDIKSHKIYFSSKQNIDCCIIDNYIVYNNEKIISLDDIRIKGMHNYENIMCAIIACKEFNISNEIIKKVLNNFNGVEHRIEFVKELNNRVFYNDSKATNVKSTIIALSSFKTPTIILLGGLDRHHSFDELVQYMNNVKTIICYGETRERIKDFATKNNFTCHVVDNLKEATILAYKLSEKGDTILLSPACASWDQYNDFEERGREFKKVVNEL